MSETAQLQTLPAPGEIAAAWLPRTPSLEDIQQLEAAMKQHPGQIELETTHTFENGFYERQIVIPAGTKLVGKRHRAEHVNRVTKGSIRVWTEEGEKIIKAPYAFVAPAGTKRVGEALEETVWITRHLNPTNERDLLKLEAILIMPENNLTGGLPCPGLQ
jgi:quercetin dioxygenase-like cupin family protein